METDRFTLPRPYRVSWGYMNGNWEDFATFAEAQVLWAKTPGSTITNSEHVDGAPDGGGDGSGLTEDERYSLELVEGAVTMTPAELDAARGPWCEQCGQREEPACWDGRCVGP